MNGGERRSGRRGLLAAIGLLLVAVLSFGGAYLAAGGSSSPDSDGAPSRPLPSRGSGTDASGGGLWDAGTGWLAIPAPAASFAVLRRDLPGSAEGRPDSTSLGDLRGQVVVLNFWATWCPPCEREIPELVRLQRELEDRPATVVGVAVESGTRAEIVDYARAHAINYPLWLTDSRTAASRFEAFGLPITLLVDSSGVIRRRYIGPQRSRRLLRDVERLLESHES